MHIHIALILAICLGSVGTEEPSNPSVIVADIMHQYSTNHFKQWPKGEIRLISGWIMETEDGRHFHRAFLRLQAEEFIKIGKPAIPSLSSYLEHPQIEIRYIAIYSIEQITELNLPIGHFATLEDIRDDGSLTLANTMIEQWLRDQKMPDHSPEKP